MFPFDVEKVSQILNNSIQRGVNGVRLSGGKAKIGKTNLRKRI